MKVEDKRHGARRDDEDGDNGENAEVVNEELETMRQRAQAAERKLQDVQGAFVAARADLEATRERLLRDADRKVELRFGNVVADLLDSIDDLDLAIEHGTGIDAAAPFLKGVVLARERFLAALQKAGITRIEPLNEPFDPNVAEAVGILPVTDQERHDAVLQVVRSGYALGSRVIRPARVLVGRFIAEA
ncbi:MAG TPA: nucleotide exchange factor GrpE [Candidatus Polarisedimenticolaceae bacterium]|nr:nucleotide exchange factor GrpE [Candidatus Polarisedimenticolaceae bacterium]